MSRVRMAVLLSLAVSVVVLLAWPTRPAGSALWMVTVGSNEAGFVSVSSGGPRLGVAALLGDPLSTADRIRLGAAGLLAFTLAVGISTRSRAQD